MKEKDKKNRGKQTARTNPKSKWSTYFAGTDNEDECFVWTAKRQAGPSLNVGAEEFIPRTESQQEEPGRVLLLEELPEEHQVGERHCMDKVSATESESEKRVK